MSAAIAETWSAGGSSLIWQTVRRLLRNRAFVIGAVIVLSVAFVAIFADWLAPYNPLRNNVRARMTAPGAMYWLGTDHFGRDILSRIIYGARISLLIGLFTVIATGVFGTIIGAAAGFFRPLDNPVMRLMDALMAFPAILLAITVSAVLGVVGHQCRDRACRWRRRRTRRASCAPRCWWCASANSSRRRAPWGPVSSACCCAMCCPTP